MKKLIIALVLLVSSFASATGGHFHPKKVAKCEGLCTEDQIKAAVTAGIDELNTWKKIDAKIWGPAKVESVTRKDFEKKDGKTLKTWVVTLLNEKETDTTKNKTYLFFLLDGSIFRNNDTGVLK